MSKEKNGAKPTVQMPVRMYPDQVIWVTALKRHTGATSRRELVVRALNELAEKAEFPAYKENF